MDVAAFARALILPVGRLALTFASAPPPINDSLLSQQIIVNDLQRRRLRLWVSGRRIEVFELAYVHVLMPRAVGSACRAGIVPGRPRREQYP
jgi:hypothetical protein